MKLFLTRLLNVYYKRRVALGKKKYLFVIHKKKNKKKQLKSGMALARR